MNKLFKISSIALAFSLCAGGAVLAFSGNKTAKSVEADKSPEFYIRNQDMLTNPTYTLSSGGSATLDSSGANYVLTLNNYKVSAYGTSRDVGGNSYSHLLFTRYLDKPLIIKLIGTNIFTNSVTSGSYATSFGFWGYDPNYDVTIMTDESCETKATLKLETVDGSTRRRSYGLTSQLQTVFFKNCIVEAKAGKGQEVSAGIDIGSGAVIEDDAEVTATGGSSYDSSYGFNVFNNGFRMKSGTLTGTGGQAWYKSIGVKVFCPFEQTGGTIIANGGNATSDSSSTRLGSIGMQIHNYDLQDGKVFATGGTSANNKSYGILQDDTDNYMIVHENAKRLVASGDTEAIKELLINDYTGTVWDNKDGDGDGETIAISTSSRYVTGKRIEFGKIIYSASANPTVDYDGLSHQSVAVSVSDPDSGYTISYKPSEESVYSSTVPSFTSSGTRSVDFKIEAKGYETVSSTLNFTINSVDPVLDTEPVLADNVDYDGLPHNALSNSGSATGGILKFRVGPTGDFWETAPLTFSNAGNYQIFYKVFGDSTDTEIVELGTFRILMADITNISVEQTGTLTYTGSAQTATVSASATTVNNQPYTFTYSSTFGGTYTSLVPSFTEAGSHTVYYKVSADNHVTETGSFTVTINPASSSYTITPSAKDDLVYNGSAQALVNAGSTSDGNVQYSLDGGAFSTTLPTATLPGTYDVSYKIVGDSNHENSGTSSFSVTISPATLTSVSVVQNGTLTYTGSAQTASVDTSATAVGGQTVLFTYCATSDGVYTSSVPSFTTAGTHTVYYKANADYHNEFSSSFTVTINPASSSYTITPSAKDDLVYNGSAQTLVNAGSTSDGNVQYSLDGGAFSATLPTATLPGTYNVSYKIVGDSNHENSGTSSFSVTISSAELTSVSVVQSETLTYTGSPQTATVDTSATAVGGQTVSFTYSSTIDGTYTSSVPSFTEVGSYTVYFKANADYHNEFSGSFTVTIEKAAPDYDELPTAKTNLSYTGSAQVLVNAGSTSDGSIQYSVNGGAFSTTLPTATLPGTYDVSYKIVGDSNHENSGTSSFSVTISSAELTSVSVSQNGALTYTGSAQTASVDTSATAVGGEEVSFTYCDIPTGEFTTSLPTFTNAGTYTVYYKASAENHLEASGSFEITISKANGALLQAPTAVEGLVANGESLALVNAGTTSDGTIVYRLGETGEFSTSIPTASEAGTYVIQYKIVGDSNHSDSQIYSVSVTISEAPITPVTPSEGETGSSSNSFPTWLIPIVIVVGVLVLLGIVYLLTFFVFNKWAVINSKPARIVKIGKKDGKVRVLTHTFKSTSLDEGEILKSKKDCLK